MNKRLCSLAVDLPRSDIASCHPQSCAHVSRGQSTSSSASAAPTPQPQTETLSKNSDEESSSPRRRGRRNSFCAFAYDIFWESKPQATRIMPCRTGRNMRKPLKKKEQDGAEDDATTPPQIPGAQSYLSLISSPLPGCDMCLITARTSRSSDASQLRKRKAHTVGRIQRNELGYQRRIAPALRPLIHSPTTQQIGILVSARCSS